MAMSPDEQSVYKSSVENLSFMKRRQWVIAGYAVAFGTNKHSAATVSKNRRPPISGLPKIGVKRAQVG
jgi:hypothetical protein